MSVVAGSAAAQSYPARPITMLVGYAVGGPSDTIARIMAERMKVVARPAGDGRECHRRGRLDRWSAAARARRPTATRWCMGDWSTHVVNAAMYDLQYDVVRDFEPVSLLPSAPQIIVTPNAVPATNLRELLAWIKADPAKVSYGTSGPRQPVACQRRAAAECHRREIPAGARIAARRW